MITTIRWVLRVAVLFALLTSCSSPLDDVAPSCNNADTTVSCCLKQYPGQLERCGAEGPPRPHMLGERGTRLDSKTPWRGERGARLDVENPAPGRRPGQNKLRSGEVWIEDDLEGYTHEGILVIETPELKRAPARVH